MKLDIDVHPDVPYPYRVRSLHLFRVAFPVDFQIQHRGKRLAEGIGNHVYVYWDYAYDGPSGPAIDSVNFMRASMLHDVLYQVLREGGHSALVGFVGQHTRKQADAAMWSEARRCGMKWWRAWYSWLAVRLFAGWAAKPRPLRLLALWE